MSKNQPGPKGYLSQAKSACPDKNPLHAKTGPKKNQHCTTRCRAATYLSTSLLLKSFMVQAAYVNPRCCTIIYVSPHSRGGKHPYWESEPGEGQTPRISNVGGNKTKKDILDRERAAFWPHANVPAGLRMLSVNVRNVIMMLKSG